MVNRRGPVIAVTVTGDSSDLNKALDKSVKKIGTFRNNLFANLSSIAISNVWNDIEQAGKAAFTWTADALTKVDTLNDSVALLDGTYKGLGDTLAALDQTKLGFNKQDTLDAMTPVLNTLKTLGVKGPRVNKIVKAIGGDIAAWAHDTKTAPAAAGKFFAQYIGGSKKAAIKLGLPFSKTMSLAKRFRAIQNRFRPLVADDLAHPSVADKIDTWQKKLDNFQLAVGKALDGPLGDLLDWATNLVDSVDWEKFWNTANNGLLVFKTLVQLLLPPAQKTIDEGLQPLKDVVGGIATAVGLMQTAFTSFVGWLEGDHSLPDLKTLLGDILTNVKNIANWVGNQLINAFKNLKTPLGTANDLLGNALDTVSQLADILASTPIDLLLKALGQSPFGFGKGTVPHSSGGGTVGGGTFAAGTLGIAPMAAAPVTINIRTGVGDPVRIGREVSRVLSAYAVRGGSIPGAA